MHLYSYVIIYIHIYMILYDILYLLYPCFFFVFILFYNMRSSSISCFLFLSYLLLLVLALALAACFFWLASYSFFLSFLALSCTLPSYRVCLLLPSVSPIAACNVFCDDAPPCCRHGVGGYALYTHILQYV